MGEGKWGSRMGLVRELNNLNHEHGLELKRVKMEKLQFLKHETKTRKKQ